MNIKQNKSSLPSNSGFTLIELAVVIVILSILYVTALPKFINIKSDANVAVINAAIGSMKSAVYLFKINTITSDTGFEAVSEFAGVKGSHYQPWAATATATNFSADYSSPPEIFEAAGLNVNDWSYRIYISSGSYAVAAVPKRALDKEEPTIIEVKASNCYLDYHWKESGEPTFTTITTDC